MENLLLTYILNDDDDFCEYKKKGIGTGHAKSGQRKKWSKNYFFEQVLFVKNVIKLGKAGFKNKFAGCSPNDVNYLWIAMSSD